MCLWKLSLENGIILSKNKGILCFGIHDVEMYCISAFLPVLFFSYRPSPLIYQKYNVSMFISGVTWWPSGFVTDVCCQLIFAPTNAYAKSNMKLCGLSSLGIGRRDSVALKCSIWQTGMGWCLYSYFSFTVFEVLRLNFDNEHQQSNFNLKNSCIEK